MKIKGKLMRITTRHNSKRGVNRHSNNAPLISLAQDRGPGKRLIFTVKATVLSYFDH